MSKRVFTLNEAALAHALAAETILEPEAKLLNRNEALIPVFINLLFQSIEITLKSFAETSGLVSLRKLRHRKVTRNGHDIKAIAFLINEKLDGDDVIDLLVPTPEFGKENRALKIICYDPKFEPSRESYNKRNLTYCQFDEGELKLIAAKTWVYLTRIAAENIGEAVLRLNAKNRVRCSP